MLTRKFEEFSLHVAAGLEVGRFDGEFDVNPRTQDIDVVRLEAWDKRHRKWQQITLPSSHTLYRPLVEQLEAAYADDIREMVQRWRDARQYDEADLRRGYEPIPV